MNSSFSTLPLMEEAERDADVFVNKAFEFNEYDDSSSGYDSSEISDVDSITSEESRDSAQDDVLLSDEEEVMNFQSTHDLSKHLKMILSMPELCDVTFLVGPREIPVYGVRAIMGTSSPVMYQLLLKHMSLKAADGKGKAKMCKKSNKITRSESAGFAQSHSQRLEIPVKKYDSEAFRMLVEFIHCGSVNITEDSVAGLFCASSQFEIKALSKACLDFVERCIRVGRVEKILFSTRCYSHHKAAGTLLEKIYSVLDKRYVARLEETPV